MAIQNSQTRHQNIGQPVPIQDNSDTPNYFQTQFLNGVGPLPSPGLENQEPGAGAAGGYQTIPTAPAYRSPKRKSKVATTGANFGPHNQHNPDDTQPEGVLGEPDRDLGLNLDEHLNNIDLGFNPDVGQSNDDLDFSLEEGSLPAAARQS